MPMEEVLACWNFGLFCHAEVMLAVVMYTCRDIKYEVVLPSVGKIMFDMLGSEIFAAALHGQQNKHEGSAPLQDIAG